MRSILAILLLTSLPCTSHALICDGAGDDTAQIQSAIDGAYGGRLDLPRGICVVTSTLSVVAGKSIHLSGVAQGAAANAGGTVLVWRGKNMGPFFELHGVRDSLFENMTLVAESPMSEIVRSATAAGVTATNNMWRNMHLTGAGTYQKGFAFVAGDGGDNNDANVFTSVAVTGYALAGWSFEHSQSKGHAFYSSEMNGQNWGRYGVTTALGVGVHGGSFTWIAGGGGNNSGADFYLGNPNDVISIISGNFESSGRLLETTGNSSNPWSIILQGNRWASMKMNKDGHAVVYTHRGPLTLLGNFLQGPADVALDVLLRATGPTTGVAIGNSFYTAASNPLAVAPGAGADWQSIGNTVSSGPAQLLPNSLR